MTEQQAIEKLITTPLMRYENSIGNQSELGKAMSMAIVALEEVQQYRATGLTPQMVNDLIKSEKEAHKIALENANLVDVYKTLEEQGLLFRLPVAIGSDVFFIPSKANFGLNILHHRQEFNRVYHQKVARINFTENGWYVEGNMYLEYGVTDRLFVDKLYKETWFTTKEEAEAALEKKKGE